MSNYRLWSPLEVECVRLSMNRPASWVADQLYGRTEGAIYVRRTEIRKDGGPPCCRDCPKARAYEHTDEEVFCGIDAVPVPSNREMCEDMREVLLSSKLGALRNPYAPGRYGDIYG